MAMSKIKNIFNSRANDILCWWKTNERICLKPAGAVYATIRAGKEKEISVCPKHVEEIEKMKIKRIAQFQPMKIFSDKVEDW